MKTLLVFAALFSMTWVFLDTTIEDNMTDETANETAMNPADEKEVSVDPIATYKKYKMGTLQYECDIAILWPKVDRLLDALVIHESRNGQVMEGDGGAARGWLHQHKSHWEQGKKLLSVDWSWPEDTDSLFKCKWIAVANWLIYCQNALQQQNLDHLVRSFRLPNDPYREGNDIYARDVLQIYNRINPEVKIDQMRERIFDGVTEYVREVRAQEGEGYFFHYTLSDLVQDCATFISARG